MFARDIVFVIVVVSVIIVLSISIIVVRSITVAAFTIVSTSSTAPTRHYNIHHRRHQCHDKHLRSPSRRRAQRRSRRRSVASDKPW